MSVSFSKTAVYSIIYL